MQTMTARYRGKCAATGRPINPGDTILYDRATRRAYLPDTDVIDGAAAALQLDPDEAAAVGRYMRQSMARSISHVWNSGGREYYRNKRGLCEDAPCCGCCNA